MRVWSGVSVLCHRRKDSSVQAATIWCAIYSWRETTTTTTATACEEEVPFFCVYVCMYVCVCPRPCSAFELPMRVRLIWWDKACTTNQPKEDNEDDEGRELNLDCDIVSGHGTREGKRCQRMFKRQMWQKEVDLRPLVQFAHALLDWGQALCVTVRQTGERKRED